MVGDIVDQVIRGKGLYFREGVPSPEDRTG
jgi:hypothetical protein